MSKPMALAAGLGLVLAIGLVLLQGADQVLAAFLALGSGAIWITIVRLVEMAGAGLAWRVLLESRRPGLLRACVGLRCIREAINNLLPVAQVGGDIVGARLLTLWRIDGGLAGASVLVDLLIQTATQVVFSVVGVVLLATLGGDSTLVPWLAVGLGVLTLGVAGFFLAQRLGGFRIVERNLLKLAAQPRWSFLGGVANLHDALQAIHGRRGAVAIASLIHLVAWFVGALEVWIALEWMGHPVSYVEALAIESLGQAVRSAGFMIPGALGVQEGGLVAICAAFGIPAPTAIAVSFAKRVPEIVIGLPGLAAWHALERRIGATARLP